MTGASYSTDTADEHHTTTPLAVLQDHMNTDMDAVNACILRHMESSVPLIPQLARYLIAAGGKRIRPLLTLAATHLYGGEMTRAHGLAAAVEFIHTATLLHDDVVDESTQRRGQDSAAVVFGNQASVLVGDFLFSRAFQLMVADGSLDVLKILSDAAATIAEGEVLQLTAAGDAGTTMATYLEIITAKTAALFAAACEVGPVIAGADQAAAQAMKDFGLNMGIAFQIADDTLDYDAARSRLGKTAGDDFREGKITAPVILARVRGTDEEQSFWMNAFKNETRTAEDFETAQNILKRTGALNDGLRMADTYVDKALAALENAPDHALRSVLSDLAFYTVRRER